MAPLPDGQGQGQYQAFQLRHAAQLCAKVRVLPPAVARLENKGEIKTLRIKAWPSPAQAQWQSECGQRLDLMITMHEGRGGTCALVLEGVGVSVQAPLGARVVAPGPSSVHELSA